MARDWFGVTFALLIVMLLLFTLAMFAITAQCGLVLPTSPSTPSEIESPNPARECAGIDTSTFAGWQEMERCLNGRPNARPIFP